mmetsp:Transcript_139714/g.243270  ORF Transcript_139714/g.243270 Transcript_139714/m.243270 type:complete len:457 (+) Transcript_139714:142-1512(+)
MSCPVLRTVGISCVLIYSICASDCPANAVLNCQPLAACEAEGSVLLQRKAPMLISREVAESAKLSRDWVMTGGNSDMLGTILTLPDGVQGIPLWALVFGAAVLVALLSCLLAYTCREPKGYCPQCCLGTCGIIFALVAAAVIVARGVLLQMAPEPSGPAPQSPSGITMVVNTEVPFGAGDFNRPGVVRTTYMSGMQGCLDTSAAGAAKVVDVVATPAPVLLQTKELITSKDSAVLLNYKVERTVTNKSAAPLPNVLPSSFDDAVIKAASDTVKSSKGKAAPEDNENVNILKEIEAGSRGASAGTQTAVQVDANFRCKAKIKLAEELRITARVVTKKNAEDVKKALEQVVNSGASDVYLELSPRCNDPSQEEAMQVCVGSEEAWFDLQAPQSTTVPAGMSMDAWLCGRACSMSKTLTTKKAEAIAGAKQQANIDVDANAVGDVVCTPADLSCTDRCQ